MKIQQKLQILLAIAIGALILVGGLGLRGILIESEAIDDIGGNRMPSVTNLLLIREALTETSRGTYMALALTPAMSAEKKKAEIEVIQQRKGNSQKQLEAAIKGYETLPADASEQALWNETKKQLDTWLTLESRLRVAEEKALKSLTEESFSAFQKESRDVIEQRRPITKALYEALGKVIDLNTAEGQKSFAVAHDAADFAKKSEITVLLIAIGLILAIGWSIIKSIMRPISIAQETVQHIAETSDLTRRVDYQASDEVGGMVSALNHMLGKVQDSMQRIQTSMSDVQAAVGTLTSASHEVANSSANQSSAAAAMASNIEQLTVSINTVSDSASEARNMAAESASVSDEGGQILERTIAEMNSINQTVERASGVIASLGKEAEQISSIVQVIKDVADQTNLLALNAAIEAARAGEQGRGFAVVADEVRKLAERTSQSTQDISQMVATIQQSSSNAVHEMQEVVSRMANGMHLATDAGERMVSIRDAAQRVTGAVVDISSALQEQSVASHDIARHVESIAQMTDENHAAADQTASEAKRLDGLAQDVSRVISSFKV